MKNRLLAAARQFRDRALHDNASSIDDRDRIADLLHLVEQVRGEQDRTALGDEATDHVAELAYSSWVEPVRRLVQNEELWVGEQAAGNSEPLAHSERVALHALVGPLREPGSGECAIDARVRFRLAGGCDHRQVLSAGQVAVEAGLLDDRAHPGECRCALGRDGAPEQMHRPGRHGGQSEEHSDQGRLPGAVRPQIAEGRTVRNAKFDVVDGDSVAEPLRQAGRLDDECRGALFPSIGSCIDAHVSSSSHGS